MRLLFLCLALFVLGSPARGSDVVRVVTTIPDLADFVRQVGGERVEVRSLLAGSDDARRYVPNIDDVKALARARVLISVGAGLEGWLPGLVQTARNGELLAVEASKGVALLRGPGRGDSRVVTPHVWLDPANVALMCRNIVQTLEAVDPAGGGYYEARLGAYAARLEMAIGWLRSEVSRLKDRRLVLYDPGWEYLARGLGFQVAAVARSPDGAEPDPRALAALGKRIRREGLRVLVVEPRTPAALPGRLAKETGIRVVPLPDMLGAEPDQTYLGLLESNVRALLEALR